MKLNMKNKLLFFFLIIILSILLVKISKKDTFDADAIVLKDINYQTLEIISDNDKIKKILNKLNSIYEIDDVYKTDFAYEILLVKNNESDSLKFYPSSDVILFNDKKYYLNYLDFIEIFDLNCENIKCISKENINLISKTNKIVLMRENEVIKTIEEKEIIGNIIQILSNSILLFGEIDYMTFNYELKLYEDEDLLLNIKLYDKNIEIENERYYVDVDKLLIKIEDSE